MGRCLWELQLWETPAQGRGWGPPNASQGRPGVLGAAHGPPSPAEPQCPRCSSSPSSCPLVPAGRPRQRGEREVRGAGPWHFWPHPQMGNFSLLHQFCLNLKRRWQHPPPVPGTPGVRPAGTPSAELAPHSLHPGICPPFPLPRDGGHRVGEIRNPPPCSRSGQGAALLPGSPVGRIRPPGTTGGAEPEAQRPPRFPELKRDRKRSIASSRPLQTGTGSSERRRGAGYSHPGGTFSVPG